jgi:hypothetical protein
MPSQPVHAKTPVLGDEELAFYSGRLMELIAVALQGTAVGPGKAGRAWGTKTECGAPGMELTRLAGDLRSQC